MINQLRKIISDYFGFNRAETNGLILIFILMFILIFLPYIFRVFNSPKAHISATDVQLLDSLVLTLKQSNQSQDLSVSNELKVDELFRFDPNKSSAKDLEKLGFNSKIARRIVNYRQAGGHYRIRKDLQKIYGLSSEVYSRVYDYIDLPEVTPIPGPKPVKQVDLVLKKKKETIPNVKLTRIDLNQTDTSELKRIRGIGVKLSGRIIKYGELLGGYVSVNQLDDVYGLKGDALDKLKKSALVKEDFNPQGLKVNFCDWYTLVKHPYINKDLANDIITGRSNHGPFRKIEDLAKILGISDSVKYKLEQYLEF